MRPVITGYGLVTTHGSGAAAAWAALAEGKTPGLPWRPEESEAEFFAAPIPESYRAHPEIPRNLVHFLDRASLIALDAGLQALAAAGIASGAGDARRFALVDGLAYRAPGQATLFVPYGHLLARVLGVRGPVLTVGGAEASGMAAVAAAARLVASGTVDVAIAGAAQALQLPLIEHLRAQGFAAKQAARPFDVDHNGFTAAEGAAYVVLESAAHAAARGAPALATVSGVGEVFDGVAEPLAISDAAEAGRAMQAALGDAGYLQNQVDVLVSCADGRPAVDFAEGYATLRTFGRHAYYATVAAPASVFGHTLAASGPLAIAAALEMIRHQQVPPIAGFETAERDLDLAYARALKQEKVSCLLVTSLGLGGTNVSLLIEAA